MRWMPLQDIKTKKWILCVMDEDHLNYERTDIISDSIETILSCSDFMNGTSDGSGLGMLPRLRELKARYDKEDNSRSHNFVIY